MLLLKKNIQSQKGQVLVLSVIMMPILLIMSILIIEVGFVYIKQSQLQNAADAIALAHITDKDEAINLVKLNRTVDFDEKNLVKENLTPPDFVDGKVTLEEKVKPVFNKIFGDDEIVTITAKSKAEENKLVSN